jgi:hypothetical protein
MRSLMRFGVLAAVVALAACGDDDNGPSVLGTPAGFTVNAISSQQVELEWNTVSGAVGYSVERAPGASGTFAEIATPTDANFTDADLEPNTTYSYRVRARASDAAQNSPFTSGQSVTTLAPGRQEVQVTSDITTSTTWVPDNVYRLIGFRKVANGATLTIEPGTRIVGDFDVTGSSLFVLRGGRIDAQGTTLNPIVFTSSRAAGTRQSGDWGGLILVGNGIINRADPTNLEGTGTGTDNPLLNYGGGTNNADNSGTLRYVRVEFAGFGPAQDQELNSFTFAAVGSGTTMEYLQSIAGLDDAFEWFGGAADGRYLVSYDSGDDHFDMSEGYIGRLQFLVGYQNRIVVPRPTAGNTSTDPQGLENDGCAGANCVNGQDTQPFTIPLVTNFTLVGFPSTVSPPSGGARGAVLRRGTGGYYVNGIIARWVAGALSVRDAATTGARLTAGELDIRNHLLADTPAIFDASTNVTVDPMGRMLNLQSATAAATLFTALPASPADGAALDWTPPAASLGTTGGLATFTGAIAAKAGTFASGTSYVGGADPAGPKWWQGWTVYFTN